MHKEPLKPRCEQVVVVTISSSGTGRETALQCAELRAAIVPLARTRESFEELMRESTRSGEL